MAPDKNTNKNTNTNAARIIQADIPLITIPAIGSLTGNHPPKRWLIWLGIGVCCLLGILDGKTQNIKSSPLTNPAPLHGTVTDGYGQPLSGVQISTLPSFSQVLSDSKGAFVIRVSRFTRYIQAEKGGYHSVKISLDHYRDSLNIHLTKITDSVLINKGNKSPDNKAPQVASSGKSQPENAGASDLFAQGVPGVLMYREGMPTQSKVQIRGNGLSFYRLPFTPLNTESYANQQESGFKSAASSPLSTFSIDVDKASYSNVRRFINQGVLPPKNAIRIEELINYFDYDYRQPAGKHPIGIQTELGTAPWNPKHYLLHIGLQARKVATDELPPGNLVFLIDVSGSMAASNKLPLLISSFKMLTDQLRQQDYVSIVTYAGTAQNVLAPTSGADKKTIKAALDQLRAYGSTNGAGGLEKAYAMAANHFKKGGNNRIILASDGDFNVGASGLEQLEALITAKRKSGIYLSVLGFGMGNLKDDKMELLSDKGNGNYAYIDNSAEARRVLLKEFGGTLFTVARDVKVQVEFNPRIVQAYRLVGYENRALADEDFNRDSADAGEMGSNNTVTALYEIIPQGIQDEFTPHIDTLRYAFKKPFKTDATQKELGTVKIRYKDPGDYKDTEDTKSKLISQTLSDKVLPESHTSASFRLAAAVAGWGMLLRNSPFAQQMTYDQVASLIQSYLTTSAGENISKTGEFLTLVKTSQALEGNEAKSKGQAQPTEPPVIIRPRPRPRPRPLPHPQVQKAPVSTFGKMPAARLKTTL